MSLNLNDIPPPQSSPWDALAQREYEHNRRGQRALGFAFLFVGSLGLVCGLLWLIGRL
jgi:hypothetical protein